MLRVSYVSFRVTLRDLLVSSHWLQLTSIQ